MRAPRPSPGRVSPHCRPPRPSPRLRISDEPLSNPSCPRRRRSNTPLQSLNLLNDPVFFEAAQSLARVEQASRPVHSRIDRAFELCLARKPSEHERSILTKLYAQQGPLAIARVLLNLDEFITRE